MKWAVLGRDFVRQRYEILSRYLNSLGFDSDLHFVDTDFEELADRGFGLIEGFDQIRVDAPFTRAVIPWFKQKSMMMNVLGAADALVRRDGVWWPESTLYLALNRLLSQQGEKLDLSGDVLLVGGGAAARVAAASVLRAGFTRVLITSRFDDEVTSLISELKSRYLGVELVHVPQDRLVLLPGSNSLLINTTPEVASNDLLPELYYLNFLKPDGIVWDFAILPLTTTLVRESEHAGVRCVRGFEVAAFADRQWLEWVTGRLVDEDEIKNFYHQQFAAL